MLRDANLTTQGANNCHLLSLKLSRVLFTGCCNSSVLLYVLALTESENCDSRQKQPLFDRPTQITLHQRPNIKTYTLKDNEAGPWKDAINIRGYCGYKNSAWGEQWCSLGEEHSEPQTATALCSHSSAIPQFNDLCSRPQTIKPRNIISFWPTQKLAFSSLLRSQNLTTVGCKVNSCNDKIP